MLSLVTSLKATSTRMADHAARSGVHAALHHHLLLALVVFMSASALLGSVLVSRASATHVQCGDAISASGTVTLDSDVVCPDTFTGVEAISITASDVTLDLAGYTISAGTTSTTAGVDIFTATGAPAIRGIKVLNGTITDFQLGVRLSNAVETHIRRLAISAPMSNTFSTGISVTPAQGGAALPDCQTHVTICITRNVVSVGGTGIEVTGDDVQVWRNTINADSAIYVTGDRPRVALNRIESCGRFGILVIGYSTYAVVWNNTILGCDFRSGSSTGIYAAAATEGGGSARVRLNHVTNVPGFGIRVTDTNALIAGNDSSGNTGNLGSGIVVGGPAGGSNNVVRQNNADNNEASGIDAPDAIDGGGNTASGNGTQDCTPNLTCGP
jgi:Right handed beta helix region